jgi:hypothetical protein
MRLLSRVDANKDRSKAAFLSPNIHAMTGITPPHLQVGMPRGAGWQKAIESRPPGGVRLSLSPGAVDSVKSARKPSGHDVQIELPCSHSINNGLERFTASCLRPNELRFRCGGLRRPPPSIQHTPVAGRRVQAPGSSKRWLGGSVKKAQVLFADVGLVASEARPLVLRICKGHVPGLDVLITKPAVLVIPTGRH